MKGLPSKGHDAYKIHILLMKSRAYPQPPPPAVLLKTLIHDFFKNPSTHPPSPINKWRVHTMAKL